MWLWDRELQAVGFRRRSSGYWQCERRFGLPAHAYISLFAWSDWAETAGEEHRGRQFVEVSAFHVTFMLDFDNVHFYYHEHGENVWEPGGHTSSLEIERHGVAALELRVEADAIAARLVAALKGEFLQRDR